MRDPVVASAFFFLVVTNACNDDGARDASVDARDDTDVGADGDSDADVDADVHRDADAHRDADEHGDADTDRDNDQPFLPQRPTAAGIAIIWAPWNYVPEHSRMLQSVVKWEDIEPERGVFDWSRLDRDLELAETENRSLMIQVNMTAPEWIFDHVAAVGRVTDPANCAGDLAPQYWDPLYVGFHYEMLEAYAAHIAMSPLRERVVGVRVQANAFGTEYIGFGSYIVGINEGDDPLDHTTWQTPGGHYVEPTELTAEVRKEYLEGIIQKHIELFHPLGIYTAVRARWWSTSIGIDDMDAYFIDYPLMMVLDTGAGLDAMNGGGYSSPRESRICAYHYTRHLVRDYGALLYWEEADTHVAPIVEQDIYWLALMRLDAGTTYVAVRGINSETYDQPGYEGTNAGLDFVNRYAGYLALPEESPGAWLALIRFDEMNACGIDHPAIDNLGFFIEQNSSVSTSVPVQDIGNPGDHRGWRARRLVGDATFHFDSGFLASIDGYPLRIEVTHLDQLGVSWRLLIDESGALQPVGESVTSTTPGQWRTETFDIDEVTIDGSRDDQLSIDVLEGEPVIHMLEVVREP